MLVQILLIYFDYANFRIQLYTLQAYGAYSNSPSVTILTNGLKPINSYLSNDLLCIVFQYSTNVSLYRVDANSIQFIQYIRNPNLNQMQPFSCTISNNKKLIILGYGESSVPIGLDFFSFNENKFEFKYNLKTKQSSIFQVQISKDTQTLIVGGTNFVQAFIIDCTNNQFKTLGFIYDQCSYPNVEIVGNGLYVYLKCLNNNEIMIFQREHNLVYSLIQKIKNPNQKTNLLSLGLKFQKNGLFIDFRYNLGFSVKFFKLNCSNAAPMLCAQCYYPCQTCLNDKTTCLTYAHNYTPKIQAQCRGCPSNCKKCKFNQFQMKFECQICQQNYILNQKDFKCTFNFQFDSIQQTQHYFQFFKSQSIVSMLIIIVSIQFVVLLILAIIFCIRNRRRRRQIAQIDNEIQKLPNFD